MSAFNPNREASALLRTQVEHMHIAERRLPERYRTKIYVNAIQTEGEVAAYIGQVTTAIAQAHQDAARKRAKLTARPGSMLKIAAKSDSRPRSKSKSSAVGNNSAAARSKGKSKSK
jgi:hypothetical protein